MLDPQIRKSGPDISPIRKIDIPSYELTFLDNGIPVYHIKQGSQELVKLDIVFEGGRLAEENMTESRVFGSIIKESTSKYNSEELSNFFDYYGASYGTRASLDFTTATLFSLTKYFSTLLERFKEIILDPIFPEKEFNKFVQNSIQKLQLDNSKNDTIAYRKLTEKIFGANAVYGYNSTEQTYNNLSRQNIIDYYQRAIKHQPCKLFLCGQYSDQVLEDLNVHFGQWNYKGDWEKKYTDVYQGAGKFEYEAANKLQCSIRMGRPVGNRKHEDFARLSFLSNVFGGFFGSRLMKNIREDKAYTYNIYSDLDTMLHDGYFYVATELDNKYLAPCLKEIDHEMKVLRTDLIGQEELDMNKNYILGNLLNSIDGPFQAIRLIKSTILNRQTMEDLQMMIDTFANISSEEVLQTARKYLDPQDYLQVVVK